MRSIGVVSHKGGVGKTTTAINLAAALASKGFPTLLVDADPQGAVVAGLGGDPAALSLTLLDALEAVEEGRPIPGGLVMAVPSAPGLHLVPSDVRLAHVEQMGHGAELLLARAVDALAGAGRWEFVVIDAPPGIGVASLSVLLAARELVIPAQAHYFGVMQLRQFTRALDVIRRRYRHDWDRITIVPTMVERATRHAAQCLAALRREYADLVSATVIPKAIAVASAQQEGVPLARHAPSHPAALAYGQLADEIAGDVAGEGAHGGSAARA